jgi:hypothetical protein
LLGTGSVNNINQSFSFGFLAARDGLKEFLKGGVKTRRSLLKRMKSIEGLGRGCVYEAAKEG